MDKIWNLQNKFALLLYLIDQDLQSLKEAGKNYLYSRYRITSKYLHKNGSITIK